MGRFRRHTFGDEGVALQVIHPGSAILQNTRPMPMPALNSMENQAKWPNSGTWSSSPSRMLPKLGS